MRAPIQSKGRDKTVATVVSTFPKIARQCRQQRGDNCENYLLFVQL